MRAIRRDFAEWLHGRIKNHSPNPNMLLIQSALACEFQIFEKGDNKGEKVEQLQSTIGKAEGESWCMSFIQSLVAYVEVVTQTKCNIAHTESCLHAWDKAEIKCIGPNMGSIAIWKYGDSNKGHCGIVVKEGDDYFETIEGNTGAGLGINRDGDGVYKKIRSLNPKGNMKLLGFIALNFVKE